MGPYSPSSGHSSVYSRDECQSNNPRSFWKNVILLTQLLQTGSITGHERFAGQLALNASCETCRREDSTNTLYRICLVSISTNMLAKPWHNARLQRKIIRMLLILRNELASQNQKIRLPYVLVGRALNNASGIEIATKTPKFGIPE